MTIALYRWLAAAVLAATAVAPPPLAAQAPERPGLFQEYCGACHANARTLIEQSIDQSGGFLRTRRRDQALVDFLPQHVRRLTPAQSAIIAQALQQVAQGKGRFKEQCGICHHSAENLAHYRLILDEETLLGRYSNRPIADFLLTHGTASAEEAAFFTSVLTRHTDATR